MYFNFKLFTSLTKRAFKNIQADYGQATPYIYPLEDTLSVFRYYFQKYEDTFREVHPNIRITQIQKIAIEMPWLDSEDHGGQVGDIEPGDYPSIIDKHFLTKYRNCDYNINHFFSGDIRLMRYYEELY